MAGLNITLLSLVKWQSDKKTELKLTCHSVFPFRLLQFSSSTAKQTKLFHSNFRDVFNFFLREKPFRWMSAKRRCNLQAPIKGGNFGAKLTHLSGFWLDVSFFLTHEKTSFAILIGRIIFFTCENDRALLWLAWIHLHMKIYDIAFWWVFLSMYIIIIAFFSWVRYFVE